MTSRANDGGIHTLASFCEIAATYAAAPVSPDTPLRHGPIDSLALAAFDAALEEHGVVLGQRHWRRAETLSDLYAVYVIEATARVVSTEAARTEQNASSRRQT